MKFTNYFIYNRQRPDRSGIKMEWIEKAFNEPFYELTQSDGRIRRWAYIEETKKYLRIVVLEDNETIHNAFFDRSFKIK